jgi:hypothetical protein
MTHLISGKRHLAVYLRDEKPALTLVIQDMKAGWVAQLLDHRPPNEAKPLLLCYEIVSDPNAGKAVLEQELNEFLEAESWPKMALLWHESELANVGLSQLDK